MKNCLFSRGGNYQEPQKYFFGTRIPKYVFFSNFFLKYFFLFFFYFFVYCRIQSLFGTKNSKKYFFYKNKFGKNFFYKKQIGKYFFERKKFGNIVFLVFTMWGRAIIKEERSTSLLDFVFLSFRKPKPLCKIVFKRIVFFTNMFSLFFTVLFYDNFFTRICFFTSSFVFLC